MGADGDSTFKGIVVVMNIDVPSADIRDVNLKARQSGGLCLPDDRFTFCVLISDKHSRVCVRVDLLVVDVPLVPTVRVHQVGLAFEDLLEHNPSHNYLEVDPVQVVGDEIGCEPDVQGGEGGGGGGGVVDQVHLGPGHLHMMMMMMMMMLMMMMMMMMMMTTMISNLFPICQTRPTSCDFFQL